MRCDVGLNAKGKLTWCRSAVRLQRFQRKPRFSVSPRIDRLTPVMTPTLTVESATVTVETETIAVVTEPAGDGKGKRDAGFRGKDVLI